MFALGPALAATGGLCRCGPEGRRICNGLGILRQCLETQKLEELGDRLNRLEGIDPGATRATDRQADRQAAYRH